MLTGFIKFSAAGLYLLQFSCHIATLVPSWREPGNKAATLLQSFKASKFRELCSQTAPLEHCINIKIYHGMDTVVV